MKLIRLLSILAVAPFATTTHAQQTAAQPAESQHTFLTEYEAVRAALATDDLEAAKKAAAAISANEAASALASAKSLPEAREAFKTLSKGAIEAAKGKPGYFRAHCPMVPKGEGNWVQTTKTISNPYFGKSMAKCGSIEN
jgi:hypothetical protein